MGVDIRDEWNNTYKPINKFFMRDPEFYSVNEKDSIIYKAALENKVWTWERKPGRLIAHPGIKYAYYPPSFHYIICEIPYTDGEKPQFLQTWNITVP